MAQQDDNEIFANNFIKILLEQQSYGFQIFYRVFIPYIFYAFVTIAYLSKEFVEERVTGFNTSSHDEHAVFMRWVIVLFSCLFIIVEAVQVVYLRAAYFEDFWNLFLMISYSLNLFCVFEHTYNFAGLEFDGMINVGAVAVCV